MIDNIFNLFYISQRKLKHIDFKKASGMIKFLVESCLSGLGVVLKEPNSI